ncbi:MAG: hydantoinase/oxoprolinase family protein, partial [Burkholderiales bacterium]
PFSSSALGMLIGVDTGGTFTDVALLDPADGRLWVTKTASTPADPSLGFGKGVSDGLAAGGIDGKRVARVLHGTTVATNLILERKGPAAAILVTSGFRYILEIGRHDIPRKSNLFTWVKPPRPVPPQHIWEIPGRIDASGKVVEILDEEAVRAAAREIAAEGIKTVAIVLMNSYANSAHERRVAEIVSREHPEALVSVSSEVLPVFREYERCVTTLLNAYVMPAVSTYVERLEQRTRACGIAAPLMLMKSSGGVTSTLGARRKPVETALSGPAAGAVGAAFVGASTGFGNLLTNDIGGTSADIALIQNGAPRLTTTSAIGGWRVGLPMVDIMTIGAGGGSIARVSKAGGLVVGPESAGAQPGPVCYLRGGTEPTVTDAHVVLGHLPPYLLGGSFHLDVEAAREAIVQRIARPLGMSVEAAARGILDVLDNNMVGAMRVVSVERGVDPAELVFLPFGGAGPLHGSSLARLIGCKTILIPPAPGVLSALGLLVSNLRAEFARTCVQRAGHYDSKQLASVFDELTAEAVTWLDAEEVPVSSRVLFKQASLRYKDQGFELDVPWSGNVDDVALAGVIDGFHDAHERIYSFALRDMPVEIVTLRVDAVGLLPKVTMRELREGGKVSAAIVGSQRISFASGAVDVPIYDRSKLGAGARIHGPAVMTQLDSTTLLLASQVAEVHKFGSLIVTEEKP